MAPGESGGQSSPFPPLQAELARMKRSTLSSAIKDVDEIIDFLTSAREQVAGETDSHKIGMAMMTLQNPVKTHLEAINNDLKEVNKAQKSFGKALDKAMPYRELPIETDAMAKNPELINRAVAMHLLREGQFSVASTFHREIQNRPLPGDVTTQQMTTDKDQDGDDAMRNLHSAELQDKFSDMYDIMAKLKQKDLVPAINWARGNSRRLRAKGSTLEFELSKLQFVWLFKGPEVNGLPDDEFNGQSGAFRYAREHFARFQSRHLKEIQQLCGAMVYVSNLEESPYRHIFEIDNAFEDVSLSFTREFCSLLGLSAESPLYVAVTAGALALPRLIKYNTYMKEKRTEWTTLIEMAFETPLPGSMVYHPIFVCPVSKDQTTEQNPPMLLTCGHVISRDSLNKMAKGTRYKCPYCPTEGHARDALKITL